MFFLLFYLFIFLLLFLDPIAFSLNLHSSFFSRLSQFPFIQRIQFDCKPSDSVLSRYISTMFDIEN